MKRGIPTNLTCIWPFLWVFAPGKCVMSYGNGLIVPAGK